MDKKNITRFITGFIFALVFLLSIIYGGFALFFITLLIIYFGTKEYNMILKHKGFYPSIGIILFADFTFASLAYFGKFNFIAVALTISSILAFMWVLFKGRQPYIANAATTILGFIYSGLFPLYIVFLRDIGSTLEYNYFFKTSSMNIGLGYLLLMFLTIITTDTACYYFGTKFGKHKLAPVISPNKTIEGAIGGSICAVIMAFIVGYFIKLPWYHCLCAGLLTTTFAQIGDLCESLIKRDAGVKDSGDILPGHGGFLDRTDSYVFTLPVIYYYFQYFVYSDSVVNAIMTFFKGLI